MVFLLFGIGRLSTEYEVMLGVYDSPESAIRAAEKENKAEHNAFLGFDIRSYEVLS